MEVILSDKINKYELVTNLNEEILLNAGFRKCKNKNNETYYYFCKILCSDISLNIHINLNKNFDFIKDIDVLDEAFCQPYTPFYVSGLRKGKMPFLDKVISSYNNIMNNLCNLGIFIKIYEEKSDN